MPFALTPLGPLRPLGRVKRISIAHVRYIQVLTRLGGFRDKRGGSRPSDKGGGGGWLGKLPSRPDKWGGGHGLNKMFFDALGLSLVHKYGGGGVSPPGPCPEPAIEITNFSRLHRLPIPRRDSSRKKSILTIERVPESLGVVLEV